MQHIFTFHYPLDSLTSQMATRKDWKVFKILRWKKGDAEWYTLYQILLSQFYLLAWFSFCIHLLFFLKLSMTPVRFYILSRISFLELRRLSSISRCFLGEKLKISLQLVAVERVKKLPRCELNFKLPPPALRIGIQPSN